VSPLSARYVIVDNNKDFNGHIATSVAKVGITIEYSRKGSYGMDKKIFLNDFGRIIINKNLGIKRIWMSTYTAVPKNKQPQGINLKNFKLITEREKRLLNLPLEGKFYPVFVDGYPDYYCFINRKIKSS